MFVCFVFGCFCCLFVFYCLLTLLVCFDLLVYDCLLLLLFLFDLVFGVIIWCWLIVYGSFVCMVLIVLLVVVFVVFIVVCCVLVVVVDLLAVVLYVCLVVLMFVLLVLRGCGVGSYMVGLSCFLLFCMEACTWFWLVAIGYFCGCFSVCRGDS